MLTGNAIHIIEYGRGIFLVSRPGHSYLKAVPAAFLNDPFDECVSLGDGITLGRDDDGHMARSQRERG